MRAHVGVRNMGQRELWALFRRLPGQREVECSRGRGRGAVKAAFGNEYEWVPAEPAALAAFSHNRRCSGRRLDGITAVSVSPDDVLTVGHQHAAEGMAFRVPHRAVDLDHCGHGMTWHLKLIAGASLARRCESDTGA